MLPIFQTKSLRRCSYSTEKSSNSIFFSKANLMIKADFHWKFLHWLSDKLGAGQAREKLFRFDSSRAVLSQKSNFLGTCVTRCTCKPCGTCVRWCRVLRLLFWKASSGLICCGLDCASFVPRFRQKHLSKEYTVMLELH